METNKLFFYYLAKNDKKSAIRIKKAFWVQYIPHERAIRKERRMNKLFDKLYQAYQIQQEKQNNTYE